MLSWLCPTNLLGSSCWLLALGRNFTILGKWTSSEMILSRWPSDPTLYSFSCASILVPFCGCDEMLWQKQFRGERHRHQFAVSGYNPSWWGSQGKNGSFRRLVTLQLQSETGRNERGHGDLLVCPLSYSGGCSLCGEWCRLWSPCMGNGTTMMGWLFLLYLI